MTIVFASEAFKDIRPDLPALLEEHWQEVALNHAEVPLDPYWEKYDALDKAGLLYFASMRDDGRLIGYFVGLVMPHMHYKSTLHCICDIYFVLREFRQGMNGVRLFKFVEQEMRKRGVKVLTTATKKHLDMSAIFTRLGYSPVETVFKKVL